ncbi:hypothetical protein ABES25_06075 [Bacillus gobiensis]|uniref:hypothetical protein n=1 Tax=Bacillus gobiensis TaxID=1441095 RepID=UPI003D1D3329
MGVEKVLELFEQLETLLKLLQAKREHYLKLYSEAGSEGREEDASGYYWQVRETEEQSKKAFSLKVDILKLHPDYPDFDVMFNSVTQKAEGILKGKRKKEYDKIMADMEARKAK